MKENRDWMKAMQDLRRSSAATPIPSGKKYKRRPRTSKRNKTELD